MTIKENILLASRLLAAELKYYILRPRKVFFDHLPKCGGSSLKSYLKVQYPKRKIYSINGSSHLANRKDILDFKELPQKKRFSYSLIEGHGAHELIDYIDPTCLKVTIVRNPIDRLVSHYFFVRRFSKHYLHDKVTLSNMSLEEYVASDLSDELQNWYTSHFSSMDALDVQRQPDEAIQKAIKNLLRYDIVGFLDNYSSFIKQIRIEANFRDEGEIEKHNVTVDRPSVDTISEKVKEIIQERNRLDIKLYSMIKTKFEK